jgi:hypothetical protein
MKSRRRRRFRTSLFLSVGVEIVPAKKFTAAVFLHTFSTVGKSMSHRAAVARWKRTSSTPKFLSLTNLFSIHFTPQRPEGSCLPDYLQLKLSTIFRDVHFILNSKFKIKQSYRCCRHND